MHDILCWKWTGFFSEPAISTMFTAYKCQGPLFFEYLFYKLTDQSWNPLPGNKIDFCADPPEHRKRIRLPRGLIQDGDRSVAVQNYFSYLYNKSVFKPRNLVNVN